MKTPVSPETDGLERVVEWVPMKDVARIVEKETGYRPTRQTTYNWAVGGKLRVNAHRPLRTTRRWILDFIQDHLGA